MGKGGPLKGPEHLRQGWKPPAHHCYLLSNSGKAETQGRRGGCPPGLQQESHAVLPGGE